MLRVILVGNTQKSDTCLSNDCRCPGADLPSSGCVARENLWLDFARSSCIVYIRSVKRYGEAPTNETMRDEQSIASKRRSGALTKQAFLLPLDECGRSAIEAVLRKWNTPIHTQLAKAKDCLSCEANARQLLP